MSNEYIGIEFELAHKYTNCLDEIFKNVNVKEYTWYTACSESYAEVNIGYAGVEFFLPDGVYSGETFAKIIANTKHYIHLLCLYGVPNGAAFSAEQITDYNDFLGSGAEIALISADSIVQMYLKDSDMLKNIASICNVDSGGFIDKSRIPVRLFTKETDGRTGFRV